MGIAVNRKELAYVIWKETGTPDFDSRWVLMIDVTPFC